MSVTGGHLMAALAKSRSSVPALVRVCLRCSALSSLWSSVYRPGGRGVSGGHHAEVQLFQGRSGPTELCSGLLVAKKGDAFSGARGRLSGPRFSGCKLHRTVLSCLCQSVPQRDSERDPFPSPSRSVHWHTMYLPLTPHPFFRARGLLPRPLPFPRGAQ